MKDDHTEVLVVGAGPTGLALAVALAAEGISHRIVEKRVAMPNTSRAAVVHAQTLEVLGRIGVAEAMVAKGNRVQRFVMLDRDSEVLQLSFDGMSSRYSTLLMLPQGDTEHLLEERLVALGGRVERGVEVTSVEQDEAGAVATLSGPDGETRIRAAYVVGADGMRSVVRESAGIGFTGEAYEGSFVLADINADWPLSTQQVCMFFSRGGPVVVAPLPDGRFRVVASVDEAPEAPDAADIQALLDTRGPGKPSRVRDVVWSTRFRLHHRLADTYRRGRLLLVGDAAHVHSPAGGQGMNTGLIDAVVLGELLADILRGRRAPEAIELYEELRRPAAAEVLELAGTLTWIAMLRNPVARLLRNAVLRVLGHVPTFRRRVIGNLSGIARANRSMLPPTRDRGGLPPRRSLSAAVDG